VLRSEPLRHDGIFISGHEPTVLTPLLPPRRPPSPCPRPLLQLPRWRPPPRYHLVEAREVHLPPTLDQRRDKQGCLGHVIEGW
jgi:hypothetical protein